MKIICIVRKIRNSKILLKDLLYVNGEAAANQIWVSISKKTHNMKNWDFALIELPEIKENVVIKKIIKLVIGDLI